MIFIEEELFLCPQEMTKISLSEKFSGRERLNGRGEKEVFGMREK